MSLLKLLALDDEDLKVISGHVQDSVLKVKDIHWLKSEGTLALHLRRFAWEKETKENERRQSVLHFSKVQSVTSKAIRRDAGDAVLNLLAIRFGATEEPAGMVSLLMSGGGILRLDVECIEVQLTDLGGTWAATARPGHDLE